MNAAVDNQTFPHTAFLPSGRAVLVKAKTDAGYVVELGHEDDEGESYYEGLKVVSKVFDRAPREKLDATIRELLELERSLRDGVSDLRMQKSNMESEHRKRLDYLKQFEPMQRIEDFLAGRITHYVIYDGYHSDCPIPRISTPQSEISGDDKYGDLKLLVLYGSKDRTLEWKLSYYGDGSGGSRSHCIPCCSLDEAQLKAREILTASLSKHKVPERNNCQTALGLVTAAKTLGVPLPEGFEEALRLCQIRNHESEVARKAAELATAQAQLLKAVRGEESVS